ncbi:MAG TPA: hypothetical protein VF723_06190, partial [Pyrinomonadaceae bacterium]|jgi:hypothetical protein
MVTVAATRNRITQNSTYANGTIKNKNTLSSPSGQIGIDLLTGNNNPSTGALSNGPSGVFVTPNSTSTAGGNNLLNFPVISTAVLSGGYLTLTGTAPAGAIIEFFISDSDPSGYGEGKTYLRTLTEGYAAEDTNTTSGAFSFKVPVPSGVSLGTVLTSTATVAAATNYNTSEFSANVTVALAPDITLAKCVVSGATCPASGINAAPGSDLTYRINFNNVVASGGMSGRALVITDIVPANTEFKVGSPSYSFGTTSLTNPVTVQYTNVSIANPNPALQPLPPADNDPSWSYTPTGTYDTNVRFVRWIFANGTIPSGTGGNVSFVVRVK